MPSPGSPITGPPGSPGRRSSGSGHFRPDRVVTNDDSRQIMDTNDEWIRSRVGIAERQFAGPRTTRSRRWAHGRRARRLAEAGLSARRHRHRHRRDLHAWRRQIPHAATQIAGALGIHAPGSFDLNAACAGFCYGLAAPTRRSGPAARSNVLVVGSEKLDRLDRPDRPGNGDHLRRRRRRGGGHARRTSRAIGPVVWGSDETRPRGDPASRAGTACFIQEGQTVFRWATTAIAPVAIRAVEAAGVSLDRHRRAGHPPGQPADRRRDRQEADRGRRPARPQGGQGHRDHRQHLVGVDPDRRSTGCGPPARRRPATSCWPSASAPA